MLFLSKVLKPQHEAQKNVNVILEYTTYVRQMSLCKLFLLVCVHGDKTVKNTEARRDVPRSKTANGVLRDVIGSI